MYAAWLANEHSRIHLIEQWPESSRKRAALAAARSTLDSLLQRVPPHESFRCLLCANRCGGPSIVIPTRLQLFPAELAA
jgi:hypothetical protein